MRYLAHAPKFSLFAATVILITLAVCPIGYAKAEKISFVDNQKEKKSVHEEDVLKTKRSLKFKDANIGDHSPDHSLDKPLYYKKWGNDLGDDDLQYSPQSDAIGSDGAGYESDGYGYDDDEYDHFNYKRYDSDKDKLNQDDKVNKEESSLDKSALVGDSKANAPPEATTIELLNFQAKNMDPGSEGAQSGKDEPKIKPISVKKPPYSGKDSKESLVDDNLKKKTTGEQKMDDMKTSGNTGTDKTSGNVKVSDNKMSDNKAGLYNKAEKAKVSDTESNTQINVQNIKESVQASDAKDNSASVSDDKNMKFEDLSKNEVKIVEKDSKNSDAKLQTEGKEEKDVAKVKEDKDMEPAITETKAAENSREESREKNLSQFVSNQANLVSNDYKDGFDNINTPGIIDDEKGSEDLKENRMNLAGLRDNRNELPYKFKDPGNGFHRSKYVKKEATDGHFRRKIGSRSNLVSGIHQWDTNPLTKEDGLGKNALERGPKEPFHLDFPLADLENTDYHKNFIKSLKRFKGLDESSRILSQGDTPSPYADESKKQLASKVIEEEQRKRRSRLRRLKENPIFASMRKRERDGSGLLYAYGPSARARMQYGPNEVDGSYRRDMQGYDYETSRVSPGIENIRGRGFSEDEREIMDPLGEEDMCDDDEYEEMTRNIKNKRRDTAGFYEDEIEADVDNEEEEDSFAENDSQRLSSNPTKRKSQVGKNAWARSEYGGNNQKKKYNDLGLYEEPSRYNTPLLLLQRNDNGQQSMKTFTDGRYKNEDGIDSEDLARLLSRDSNYVVLKKVPNREQVQKIADSSLNGQSERAKTTLGDQSKKDKLKVSELGLVVKAQHSVNTMDPDLSKVAGSYKEARVEQPLKKKEDRIKDLSDFFKEHSQDKEIDEKKEMLVSIDNRMSQYERGEPNKRLMYKPPLSQAYRHMKDFENSDGFSDAEAQQRGLYNASDKKNSMTNPNQAYVGSERLMKSFKKEGKEVVLMNNQPFSSLAYKAKGQEAMQSNVVPNMLPTSNAAPIPNMAPMNNIMVPTNSMFTASNVVPNNNLPQTVGLLPTGNTLSNPNGIPSNYMIPNSNIQPNGFMQNNNNMMQIKLPEISQKASDINRKYFLYGSDNDISNSPKHEVKVIQSDFGVPQDNTQTYSLQNYNKPNPTKNTQSGKATPTNLAPGQTETNMSVFPMMQQSTAYDYSKANAQQCTANGYQSDKKAADMKENFKKVSKKESEGRQLSNNLKRFMRDFQGLGQANKPNGNSYNAKDLSGMSLQELTNHGDRHFQKLNNLLKEIMNNKVEVSGNELGKNMKRGMFPKYKDQRNWQFGAESPVDPQVRSGKGGVYGSSRQAEFVDKEVNVSPDESLFNDDGESDSVRIIDVETPQNVYSKRAKRESPYDGSKDSTKALEVKVKSTPYTAQLQQLNPVANNKANANSNSNSNANTIPNTNTNGNTNSNQQQKSTARASLQLPPDKLLKFMASERDDARREEDTKDFLCRRQAPFIEAPSNPPFGRKLLSLNENEPEQESKRADNIRKSFESYLDPLVQKISGHENKSQDKSKRSTRSKRQIELDESMPNDFQNFLVTSLGGFGDQKREVVKKEEALWEKEGTYDDSNQIVDGTGNREPNEESTLGKRDTSESGKRSLKKEEDSNKSKNEKKSVSKGNDATNIRIRIVDGNPNGELITKTLENEKNQFAGKSATKNEKLGENTSKNEAVVGQDSPGIHELYLITNKDSNKRKKKKFATPRSDQTPQKQPISNHLPQVETVYNPSPGSNKAQIEKINSNDAQMKMKCLAKPSNVYNATASMMEDNIIRNNLRTGNINTFTYQRKEEPTPYPLRNPTNPPTSNEFEMLDSKNPSRPKSFSSRFLFPSNHFAGSSLTNTNPEIIYKDEASQQFSNIMNNAKPVYSKQGYRSYNVPALTGQDLQRQNSGMKGRMYKSGPDNSNPDPYQKDYAEDGSSYTEYSDPEEANSFSTTRLNHQVDSDYEGPEAAGMERNPLSQGTRRQDSEDRPYTRAQDNLNPKMIEMWNNYARTHLTPETHREAMNREFRETYLKRNLGRETNLNLAGLAGCIPLNLQATANEHSGSDLMRNLNQHDHLTRDNRVFVDNWEKLDERLSKTKKRAGPVQIGRRFFYTFKTEVPDEEFYALITEPVKLKSGNENSKDKISEGNREEKKSGDIQLSNRQQSEKMKRKAGEAVKQSGEDVLENVIGSYIVHKGVSDDDNGYKLEEDKSGARQKRKAEVYQAGNDLVGHRVKRSGNDIKSADESKAMEKRMSSGHLTESHYKKYHRKNFNNKRNAEDDILEPDSCPKIKRDAISDAVKADMMKRIQEEKKAKSMVKNLKVDLAKSDIPLIGPGMVPPEETLPSEMLRLEEEKRRNKMMEENRYRDDQQHRNPVKTGTGTGTPDIYRTFEIKRGKRYDVKKAEHNRVSRSEPDSYQDRVFLKGVRARKVNKYSDEGFEPITPDLRFSEKSSANYYFDNRENKAAADEPYKAMLDERSVTSIVNRKAEEKSKVKDSNSANVPKQKLTHGFSHEAPLLTLTNPLGSVKIVDALKATAPVASPKNDLKALNQHSQHPNEAVFLGTLNNNLQKGNHPFKIAKLEEGSKKSQPLVGAVLVLAKREKTNKRHTRDEYSHAEGRVSRNMNRSAREEEYNEDVSGQSRISGTAKRSPDWRQSEGISDSLNSDQSAEIVIDNAECRSCGGETETKTCNHKQTNNFKQSPFPFSQSHNMNTDRNGVGNSGEDILESILGRVESNPHFRKVIGPGLKWRGRKCCFDGEDRHRCCYPPPNRSFFVRQVRKILAKFVVRPQKDERYSRLVTNDIEKLAAQDMRRNPCCKLDGRSNRFLHELLEVPYESNEESMQNQYKFQLDPILRGRGTFGTGDQNSNVTFADAKNVDSASVEAMQNRRQLVLKLLGEYQNLSEDDRKKVEVLGQYLMHELEVLNSALQIKEEERPKEEVSESVPASTTTIDKKCEERSTSASTQGTEACIENVTFAQEISQTTDKDIKRGSVKIPFIWTNPEDVKFLKSGYQVRSQFKPEQISSSSGFKLPNVKDFGPFPTSPMEAGFPEIATDNPEPLPLSFSKINLSPSKFFPPTSANKIDDDISKSDEWSSGYRPEKKGGELHKLGYGDAAGLQLSLKSHGPWLSNLDLGKGKPVDIWQRSKTFGLPFETFSNGVTDLPYYREDSVDTPQFNNRRDKLSEEDSDGPYDLEYQDYDDDDDAYQAQGLKGWKESG